MTIRMHKKVKITVLRTEYYQEPAEQYAIPNLGKCGVAWQVIAFMARQLSLGELVQPSGTWLKKQTGSAHHYLMAGGGSYQLS